MNNRIFELAEKAGSTHKQNLGVYQFFTAELEQFAKSIIDECRNTVSENFHSCDSSVKLDSIIAEHFGINQWTK